MTFATSRTGAVRSERDRAVACDDEWRWSFRPGRSDVAFALLRGRLAAPELYRHELLNPKDRYIPPWIRATLPRWLEPQVRALAAAQELLQAQGAAELRARIARGEAPLRASHAQAEARIARVLRADLYAGLEYEMAYELSPRALFGREPCFVQISDGVTYGADLVDLPDTRRLHEARRQLYSSAARELITWFVAADALEPVSAPAVMQRFAAAFATR